MLTRSFRCLSRVPETGHETTARVRWASYSFWYAIDPVLRRHHWYFRRKALLDRFLEKNSFFTNVAFGITVGATAYYTIVRSLLLPPSEAVRSAHSMTENAREVLDMMNYDTTKQLPAFQIMRAKREIIGKLHAVVDLAEVQRQRKEVEQLKQLLQ